MPGPYGVLSTGFSRKPLTQILAELEAANIDVFGPGVIQTPQSPLGQLNGLRADAIAEAWEIGEEAYQSRDPEQTEGTNLDILARLRLIARMPGETDESLLQAIINAGVANTRDADFYRAVVNVAGVTWAKVYSNDTITTDGNGIPAHSVTVAALGGENEDIALVARQYVVPGISTYGNTVVSTEVDGFCRSMSIMRPAVKPLFLNVEVRKTADAAGCPPPSNAAIAVVLHAGLTGAARPANGQDITLHLIRTIISCVFPNVEVLEAEGGAEGDPAAALPVAVDFDEIATFDLDMITVTAV